MVIAYRETTTEGSESLGLCEGPFLQVGNLSVPEDEPPPVEFCIRKQTVDCKSSFERCFDNETGRIRSVIVISLAEGTYSFPGWISGHNGSFSSADGQMDFAVDLNLNSSFLDVLFFGRGQPTCEVLGWPISVKFEKSSEGNSRILTESRAFQNARFIRTDYIPFSEFHGTENRKNAPKSIGFDLSRVDRISTHWSESTATLRETWPEATGSTTIWIGAGISLAALLIIMVIVLLLGCRHWSLRPSTGATESDMEMNIPADGGVSSTEADPFLSEENALSVDRKIPGVLAEDVSEGAVKASAHSREANGSEKRT
jgi:hypothetical protein